MNKLEQLKTLTTVVADTGDIDSFKVFQPTDTTTNPSLILAAAQLPQYAALVDQAIANRNTELSDRERLDDIIDQLSVNFGLEILAIVPGRVSTEVDARLSFDKEASLEKAHKLIALYEAAGIDRERVLIKLASTWEGIQAARVLEKEGIHCNLTLMFNFAQSIACAQAGVRLISPFVGRIFDWYKKAEGVDSYPADQDPGVLSVTRIFNYYKKNGYETQVMGASFRNSGEILELAGCDLLTIAPKLMEELQSQEGEVEAKLTAESAAASQDERWEELTEAEFRWHMNEDPMATEKLAEGIRNFNKDLEKLKTFLQERI